MSVRTLPLAMSLAVWLGASPLLAQEAASPRDQAARLFAEGRRLIYEEHQPDEGARRCADAYAVYPTAGALARLGACYEWAGQSDRALDAYRRAWRSNDADQNVRQFASRAIERMTGHAPVAEPVAPVTQPALGAAPEEATPPPPPRRGFAWVSTIGALVLVGIGGGAGAWTLSLRGDLERDGATLDAMRAAQPPPYGSDYAAAQNRIVEGNSLLFVLSTVAIAALSTAVVAAIVATYNWLSN